MLRHSVFRPFCLLIPIYALLCAASLAQDVPNGPEPARGFDARRPQVEYGEMVTIQYYSPVAETERSANVILPPNYDPEKKYPALYLLHGLGGDQNEWLGGAPNEILSNLLAEKKTQPAIVIIPNVRVRHKDVKTPPPFFSTEHFKEFDAFLEEFQTALKPEIEKRYKIDTRREAQAIAGLSMGGREALHLGVKLAEQFGYVGAFEPAPGILPYKDEQGLFTEDSFQFPENLRDDVYVLVVKGSSDNVVGPWPESYAKALTRAGTDPHFTVYTGGHDFNVWKRSLWLFAQNIFTEKKKEQLIFRLTRENAMSLNNAPGEFGRATLTSTTDDDTVDSNVTLRFEVQTRPQNPWNSGLRYRAECDLPPRAELMIRFTARTLSAQTESGLASARVYFETDGGSYDKSLFERVEIGRTAREYAFAFRCARQYRAGQYAFGLFFGDLVQSVEISNLELILNPDASNLPPRELYPGSEPHAQWRREAQERIEQYRKGDLTLNLRHADGSPAADATVSIVEKRSAFQWGTCVVAARLLDASPDGEKYRDFIENYCDIVVFENDLKWFAWQNARARERVDQALQWLERHNIAVRGHCLVWPSWRNSNPMWKDAAESPEKLRKLINEHILEEASQLQGRLVDWDVVNEPYDNRDIWQILGKSELASWYKLARQADPNARLYLNDYGILSAEGLDRRKHDFYYQTAQELLNAGAPLGGLGMQGHFGYPFTPPERMLEILNRMAELNLPIAITEHDVDTQDEELHAQFTRDFMTVAFSCPAVDKFLLWGFWERAHWRPNAALYTSDWQLKPAGEVFTTLVGQTWRTNLETKTNSDGVCQQRVFLGDYEITAELQGKRVQCYAPVRHDSTEITVVLP